MENLTGHYVFTLGGYRALYLLNWIYRLLTEPGYWHPIVWITGIIQTAIYCDFFYYYITTSVRRRLCIVVSLLTGASGLAGVRVSSFLSNGGRSLPQIYYTCPCSLGLS